MEHFFKILLGIHIIEGSLGLLAGSIVMFAKKGNKLHKQIGRFFAISMLSSAIVSLVLAILHPNPFLFSVGVFTLFLTGTGWRYLSLKNLNSGQKAKWIDWGLVTFMLLFSCLFIYEGIVSLIHVNYLGVVAIFFGLLGINMTRNDIQHFQGKIKAKNYWLLLHLQRMIGAYIASITAFLVVNSPSSIGILPWLLPSVILVPLIFKWSKKYKVELPK